MDVHADLWSHFMTTDIIRQSICELENCAIKFNARHYSQLHINRWIIFLHKQLNLCEPWLFSKHPLLYHTLLLPQFYSVSEIFNSKIWTWFVCVWVGYFFLTLYIGNCDRQKSQPVQIDHLNKNIFKTTTNCARALQLVSKCICKHDSNHTHQIAYKQKTAYLHDKATCRSQLEILKFSVFAYSLSLC